MKTNIAKGISADKASMFAWQKVRNGKGNPLSEKEKNREYNHGITPKKGMMICGLERIEYAPIFTLADILDILPEEVKIHRDGDTLSMIYHCGQWRVGYSNCAEYCNHTKVAPELIDALFSTLCFAIDNGHIDLTK